MEEHGILLATAEELFTLVESLKGSDLQTYESKSPRIHINNSYIL
jgi:hypothetical protein